MARYLLSQNPIQILNPDMSHSPGYIVRQPVWVIGQGLMAVCTRGTQDTYALGWLQTDGVFCKLAGAARTYFQYKRFCQWVEGPIPKFVYSYGGAAGYNLEYCYEQYPTLRSLNSASVDTGCFTGPPDTLEGTVWCRNYFSNEWTFYRMEGDDSAVVKATNLCGITDSANIPQTSHAGSNQFYVCFRNGQYALVDAEAAEVVHQNRWIDDFAGDPTVYEAFVTYCYGLDVFAATVKLAEVNSEGLHETELRIYANEGDPVQLTTPVPTPAPAQLTASQVEVYLLGAQDEPVENMPVLWWLEGDGALANYSSTTDLNGRASMTYIGPADGGGEVTIGAEVAH